MEILLSHSMVHYESLHCNAKILLYQGIDEVVAQGEPVKSCTVKNEVWKGVKYIPMKVHTMGMLCKHTNNGMLYIPLCALYLY